jgi:hypothetical protein
VAGDGEPKERNADPEDDDVDAIRHGMHEFPRHRKNAGVLDGICKTWESSPAECGRGRRRGRGRGSMWPTRHGCRGSAPAVPPPGPTSRRG